MVCLQLRLVLEIQSDPPILQAVEQLLKDFLYLYHPLIKSKTVLKHLNFKKAIGVDKIPIHGASHGMQEN